ncbi:MAG TPA: c-type cytochrome [Anaerolineae bacterium]|nr:c-type cytochrome [Anaerolineae bacterium]
MGLPGCRHRRARSALFGVVAAIAGLALLAACGEVAGTRVVGGDPSRGAQAITSYGCSGCHTIPGIRGAQGVVGPPLDFWADRVYIAGLLRNETDNLIRWIQDPQSILPGGAMPNMGVSEADARDIAAYLYTLRKDTSPLRADEPAFPGGVWSKGRGVDQPVPVSHAWHSGDLGLDCRYCHTAVETSSYAGIPATEICMNCHGALQAYDQLLLPVHESFRTGEPLAWKRVNDIADFAYFHHAAHLHKGVPCVACHGRVDEMTAIEPTHNLSMSWCLRCHRDPAPHLRPRELVFSMDWEPSPDQLTVGRQIVEEYQVEEKISCSICHR